MVNHVGAFIINPPSNKISSLWILVCGVFGLGLVKNLQPVFKKKMAMKKPVPVLFKITLIYTPEVKSKTGSKDI